MKPKRQIRRKVVLFLLILFSLVVVGLATAQGNKLLLERFVPAYGGSCQPGHPNVLAGSIVTLCLVNTADNSLERLRPGWPEGYTLEAALDLPKDQSFIPTPGLIERLDPIPYFSTINLWEQRKLLLGHSSLVYRPHLNAKNFVVHIPLGLVGHSVAIRGLYHGEDLDLQTEPDPWVKPISIIAPCDRADTARIVASWIFFSWASDDSDRVLALADSMLACNLSDAIAWNYAYTTALGLSQYDKALAYLDRMFQDFGVTSVDEEAGSDQVPRLNRDGPRDSLQQRVYERDRNGLLKLIAQEEQQHQRE